MADYSKAHKLTARSEGGYANDPKDTGGETVFGVTRRDWGTWKGWEIVDEYKKHNKYSDAIKKINANQALKDLASLLYKKNYWDVNRLGEINDQPIANQLFDIGVNMGTGRASRYLQSALVQVGFDILVDGQVGAKTIASVNGFSAPEKIYREISRLRKEKYESIVAANPSQVKFMKSWLSRIIPYEKMNA